MLTFSRVHSLGGLSVLGPTSSSLPWLGGMEGEGGRLRVTDRSEMSVGRHWDGDRYGRVLLLEGSQEGGLGKRKRSDLSPNIFVFCGNMFLP